MVLGFGIVLVGGFLWGKLFRVLGMPALMGALIFGVLIGPYGTNILPGEVLEIGSDLRLMALTIILLRAGLGLNRDLLASVGAVAFRMSFLPCLLEGTVATLAAMYFLKLPLVEAGMLGFILAAVSPAVVVPSMLALKEKRLGMKKGVPVIILAGAALDDAVAITFFSAFLGIALQGSIRNPVLIPGQILWSIIGGTVLGLVAYWLYALCVKVLKPSHAESTLLVFGLALLSVIAGEHLRVSGPLSALVLGFIMLEKVPRIAARLDEHFTDLWAGAQLLLFVLIGATVQIPVVRTAGLVGLVVVLLALVGRTLGVFLALMGSELNLKERSFAAIAYMPKATVQAAIGGVPLAMGFASGQVILAVAVLSIVFTAPLGALAITRSAPFLLEKAEEAIDGGS